MKKRRSGKRDNHLIEKRKREEKRVTSERGGECLRDSMRRMRGEWEQWRAEGVDRRETERASAGRMVREAEGEHAG